MQFGMRAHYNLLIMHCRCMNWCKKQKEIKKKFPKKSKKMKIRDWCFIFKIGQNWMMNWGYGNQMLIYIHPKGEERHESKMGNNDLREQCDREDEEMRKRVSIVCIKLTKNWDVTQARVKWKSHYFGTPKMT